MYIPRKEKISSVFLIVFAPIFFAILAGSCTNAKKVSYFQDVPDSLRILKTVQLPPFEQPIIHTSDILYISVETIEQSNMASSKGKDASTDPNVKGFMVDQNGYVEVPLVGRLQLAGKTTTEAKEMIRSNASKYFVDPIVNVRFLNAYVNVLGDVIHPGKVLLTDEKTTLLDAISMAGDLNISGRRENILLIREENGKKTFVRFNINSSDVFKSPYFYIKSGDIIYVEPIKAKARAATTDTSKDRIIGLVAAVASLVAIAITIFR